MIQIESAIRKRFRAMEHSLDERSRRIVAASEAKSLGRGGVTTVWRATGVSRRAIYVGLRELGKRPELDSFGNIRIRREGGGRKRVIETDSEILPLLKSIIEPTSRGDPEESILWVSKSLRRMSVELAERGHTVSHVTVRNLLRELEYSIQGNSKVIEGKNHPDRDAQFRFINKCVSAYIRGHQPVISVDTKKKENIGNFKGDGSGWRPTGNPHEVLTHDFIIKELGKVNPYGIYDIANNVGWVSLGVTHDTAAFAVATIRRWWKRLGSKTFKGAKHLLITADSGGSNGNRVRLWKVELQRLADELQFPIQVCHYPSGTSKWNRIEHRLFSFISKNWRGRPLISHAVMLNLIAATTTNTGLKVRCELDPVIYPKGIKIADREMKALRILPSKFHGEWNYTVEPR
jgi:hypothetical protein